MATGNPTDFGAAADSYRRGRPDYPADLVGWLVNGAERVADVGAGTGKLTGVLRGLGCAVTAIDPDPRMLAALGTDHAEVATAVGQGEDIPLPDASVDAVTYGQAWHWVDRTAASREAARVLTAGGALGLIWNFRDESYEWIAELTSVITPSGGEELLNSVPTLVEPPFGEVEHRSCTWTRPMTIDQVRDMVASRSYVIAASERDRTTVLNRSVELATKVADDAGRVTMPYRTEAYRAVLPG